MNESLLKLNKYCEAMNLKKQHRSEVLMNERSSGSNLTKMGIQLHRNTSDLGTQRLEDRTKNIVLNKRVRSSVAELRVCPLTLLKFCSFRLFKQYFIIIIILQ